MCAHLLRSGKSLKTCLPIWSHSLPGFGIPCLQHPMVKVLVKAILIWTVCSMRPVTTEGLFHAEDESSDAISLSTTLQEVYIDDAVDKPWITGLAYQVSGEAFFWGKEDGSIHAYEANTGRHIRKLLSHAEGLSVTTLSIDEEGSALFSADSSSRVIVHRLVRQHKSWIVGTASFHHRIGRSVHLIIRNRGNTRLLVASATCDTLWSMSSDAYETIDTI